MCGMAHSSASHACSFNLLNMRGSFGFKLVRGGKGGGMVRPTVVAEVGNGAVRHSMAGNVAMFPVAH